MEFHLRRVRVVGAPDLRVERDEERGYLAAHRRGQDLVQMVPGLLAGGRQVPLLQRLAENLAAATERWWRAEHPDDTGERMLKAGRDRVLRTQLRALLEVLESWFRDLMVGGGGRLINPDYREELLYAARRYPPQAAVEACRVLGEFRKDLAQNVNLRLGLEALWVRLMALRTG